MPDDPPLATPPIEQAALALLREAGCTCEPVLTVTPRHDGWDFTHRHNPQCQYAINTGLQRGDTASGTIGLS